MAEAHPDEGLVQRTVKDLVAGLGRSFDYRGTRTCKGFGEEWRLFAAIT